MNDDDDEVLGSRQQVLHFGSRQHSPGLKLPTARLMERKFQQVDQTFGAALRPHTL